MMTPALETEPKRPLSRGQFGDQRLEHRGTALLEAMVQKKSAVLNQLADTRAEVVGASRFLANRSVTEVAFIEASAQRCHQAVKGKHVLAIQDTSEFNYQAHRGKLSEADPALGPVGHDPGIGFFLHPVLVLDRDDGFPLGIAHTQVWNRAWDKGSKVQRQYQALAIEQKESYRWIESSAKAQQALTEAASVTHVTDREGDIYELLAQPRDEKTELLVRSAQSRCLSDQEQRLFEHLASLPCAGTYRFTIGAGQKKRQCREAQMEVRFDQVKLARPGKLKGTDYPAFVELFVIEARECAETVPDGESPVLWRLFTTHEVTSLSQALRIIEWYAWRWRIEELFRTLKKQGLDVESSQLENGQGLRKLALMALNAALIIMQLVGDRDGQAGQPGTVAFSDSELDCLARVGKTYEGKTLKQQNPFAPRTLAWVAWIIARLGGWKGYRQAGPAGPITMKRGLERFSRLFEGWVLHKMTEDT